MGANLDQIVEATRHRAADARQSADVAALERAAALHQPRGFRHALENRAQDGLAVIAELKKASPSRGVIREDFDPARLARELAGAGAAALSVLTDQEFFQGSLENLRLASAATALPCLRKDFIVDEFQLLESRANCADAILLIVATLSQEELVRFAVKAADFGLDVLCEVHDEQELERAVEAGCNLVGVNSRDLRSFKVDLQTAFQLAEKLPPDVLAVAESGIHSGYDLARLRAVGYKAFLIGESLMREDSPGGALTRFLAEAGVPVASRGE
jgi:indole-3-glycerol phosphate synthase